MVEFDGNNGRISETKVSADVQSAHPPEALSQGLMQDVWHHCQNTWKHVRHGQANLAEYSEAGAEVVAGAIAAAVACRFGGTRAVGLVEEAAPQLAETSPFKMPNLIEPSEELLDTLSTGTAELKKAQAVIDHALRSGFTEDQMYDPRIGQFVADVEANHPELLRTAAWVTRVMGAEGSSLEQVKLFQSMEDAGWRLREITRPDAWTAASILKGSQDTDLF